MLFECCHEKIHDFFNILRYSHTCSHQTENIALTWQKYSTEYPETIFLQWFLQTSRTLNHRGEGKQFRARYSQKLCYIVKLNKVFLLQVYKIQN